MPINDPGYIVFQVVLFSAFPSDRNGRELILQKRQSSRSRSRNCSCSGCRQKRAVLWRPPYKLPYHTAQILVEHLIRSSQVAIISARGRGLIHRWPIREGLEIGGHNIHLGILSSRPPYDSGRGSSFIFRIGIIDRVRNAAGPVNPSSSKSIDGSAVKAVRD